MFITFYLFIYLLFLRINRVFDQPSFQSLSESLHIRNGLRQGDALACILFNIALEKTIRDANINQRGNIFYKSVQILTYADDIDIISRSPKFFKRLQ